MDPTSAVDLSELREAGLAARLRQASDAPAEVLELCTFGVGLAPTPRGWVLVIARANGTQLRVQLSLQRALELAKIVMDRPDTVAIEHPLPEDG